MNKSTRYVITSSGKKWIEDPCKVERGYKAPHVQLLCYMNDNSEREVPRTELNELKQEGLQNSLQWLLLIGFIKEIE